MSNEIEINKAESKPKRKISLYDVDIAKKYGEVRVAIPADLLNDKPSKIIVQKVVR